VTGGGIPHTPNKCTPPVESAAIADDLPVQEGRSPLAASLLNGKQIAASTTTSSPVPRATSRTDIEVIVCRSGRIAPITEHDDARSRQTRSPTAHDHGSVQGFEPLLRTQADEALSIAARSAAPALPATAPWTLDGAAS
jgi:hypothetical protein